MAQAQMSRDRKTEKRQFVIEKAIDPLVYENKT